jgi:hypothetical protein
MLFRNLKINQNLRCDFLYHAKQALHFLATLAVENGQGDGWMKRNDTKWVMHLNLSLITPEGIAYTKLTKTRGGILVPETPNKILEVMATHRCYRTTSKTKILR